MLSPRNHLPVATAVLALISLAGCHREPEQNEVAANSANAVQQQTVPQLVPTPQAPLSREDLLIAASRAASDFAAGIDDRQRQKDLADKKFEFRIRFGCNGPAADLGAAAIGWTLNTKTQALKVRATPTLSSKDSAVQALAGTAFETVEGFWIRQPWLLGAVCPRQTPAPADQQAASSGDNNGTAAAASGSTSKSRSKAAPAGTAKFSPDQGPAALPKSEPALIHSVGIAQFFTATDPRTLRRSGRPYEATKKLDEGDLPKGGFDLILSGRLTALPNGKVVACTETASGGRPACVVSVDLGKVSIERADTHEQLAQWGTG